MSKSTIQLYNLDSHTKCFQAKVLSCVLNESSKDLSYLVVLDQTAFFPEGGGQPADTGVLNGIEVIDVQEKDNVIYHTVLEPINMGMIVIGEIDWDKRFDLMQHHTGEHIVSGLIHKYFGFDNVGFHMGTDAITIDFNGSISIEDLRKIEYEANLAVYKNIPIVVSYPSKEELSVLNYRSKKELSGDIRIVSIEDYDICACCAPHVALTGEIGNIKIVSLQSYKGGVRVSMLCGLRALSDYNKKEENVSAISALLSAKPYEVKDAVKSLKEENTTLKNQLIELQNNMLTLKADSIKANNTPLWIFDNEIPVKFIRNYTNLLLEKEVTCVGVFASDNDIDFKYVLAGKNIDIRPITTKLNETFQGKGGGSKDMAQGAISGSRNEILDLLNSCF
ncbi:MAG: putative metal-dependent hydrolase related to alanyl-tRNA synthetase HxxxH domain [Anaerocolumna sp.]|jgi:alanyl-tRNA synthetase|nr:putative metal-dependent hydrolase related to alanyl-tRNA synthetase HxxxH domain [Anaerocolumna sp.]